MNRTLIPLAIATAALAVVPLTQAQDSEDPFAPSSAKRAKPNPNDPFAGAGGGRAAAPKLQEPARGRRNDLSIKYEAFSLNLDTAAALMRKEYPDVALYKAVVALVDAGKAVQENLTVVRTRSGLRATADAIDEYIYPTEWEPAELPQNIGIKIDPPEAADAAATPDAGKAGKAPPAPELPLFTTPATATAFETRPLGFTLEVEANSNPDGRIDARVAPQHTTLANLASWGKGVSLVKTPEFESQRISTQVMLIPGLTRLIGTVNRPVVSKVNPEASERIWFAFMTASHVK